MDRRPEPGLETTLDLRGVIRGDANHQARLSNSIPPYSPPNLPSEIWSMILGPLSTITLKTSRLVCRQWAEIGQKWLFQTVYLDSFPDSWTRLEKLSHSSLAPLVSAIVWTPFYLLCDGPDPEEARQEWMSCYSHLLQDLSQTEVDNLHKIFWRVLADTRYLEEDAKPQIGSLKNCQKVLLLDVWPKDCSAARRREIQRDVGLLRQPAVLAASKKTDIWGLVHYAPAYALNSINHVFDFVQQSSSITQLDVFMWQHNLEKIKTQVTRFTTGVKNLRLRHRCLFVEIRNHHGWYTNSGAFIAESFEQLQHFPSLQTVELEVQHFNASWDTLDDEGRIFTLPDLQSPGKILSRHELDQRLYLRSIEAVASPGLQRAPRLTELTLHNMTIDTQSLLVWLCNQDQIPMIKFHLRLKGYIIIYGSNPTVFLQLLSSLNVDLSYDRPTTLFYRSRSYEPEYGIYDSKSSISGALQRDGSNLCYRTKMWTGAHIDRIRDLKYDKTGDYRLDHAEPFESIEDSMRGNRRADRKSVQFKHRPRHIKEILILTNNGVSFDDTMHYYCCVDTPEEKYVFEWMTGPEMRELATRKEVHVLLSACANLYRKNTGINDPHWRYLW